VDSDYDSVRPRFGGDPLSCILLIFTPLCARTGNSFGLHILSGSERFFCIF
jgi:hypothetical protein